ncbi:MAG: alpha/beta fold hydrolase [Chitinophagaceae bacterium]|nr:alpha/beta fold hydrolase [Chitinophagaceae bacterium]MBP6476970.1 alpha/beta fold hydrolase [Chitinophagaceae bacterium]MBP7109019.1 alpha/beta fold hydrolase [Chitinophagaceae bacterium]MBP7314735.1 alpha/beta fold hydrolase [Chitinophagaceae bacterium]HQV54337.1 alpha/beta fold hydrolase [Chitinophagaceae bacterium]
MINKKSLRKFWKWFKIITLIYIMIGVALYFLQDKFIFHPKKLPTDYEYKFEIPFRQIDLAVSDEKNMSIVQFTVPDSVRKGVVLYFHGNRENINRYAPFAKNFTRNNYEVWMMDYPGYGKSTGKRKEKILYEDALTFYKMAMGKVAADSIIIYGKSLGTGIAAQLASVRDCKKLILETPYYSMDALAKHYFFIFPVVPMTKYSIPTHQYFEYISAPISIFHGTNDRVIPYKHAKRLTSQKNGTELITIEKGRHNNLNDFPLFHEKLDSLLQQ